MSLNGPLLMMEAGDAWLYQRVMDIVVCLQVSRLYDRWERSVCPAIVLAACFSSPCAFDMTDFLRELWALLSVYKLYGHWADGTEVFAVPLSWLFVLFLLCLFLL